MDIGDAEAHIANLSLKLGILQFPLDLQFESGSRISFYTTGAKSNVHLSGYVMFEEEELPSDEEDNSSEEGEAREHAYRVSLGSPSSACHSSFSCSLFV